MSDPSLRIGFMQGRLSRLVDGRIQAFPVDHWREEFPIAHQLGFGRMEWTLDQDGLHANPLMVAAGQSEIRGLAKQWGVAVTSITGDCFMQAPFWKAQGHVRERLIADLVGVIHAAAAVGAGLIVVPLVDNGALENGLQDQILRENLHALSPVLGSTGVRIAFETDLEPQAQMAFIEDYPSDLFGINFDMGNSASLGWPPEIEIPLIASRIINVHVKDRVLGGMTVPLGDGHANLPLIFQLLRSVGYNGYLILQTARAADGDHVAAAQKYLDLVISLTEAQ